MKKLLIVLLWGVGYCALGQAPTISSFSPASGSVGTSVTINGTNFNNTPANNIVIFGATAATVTAATALQLTVTVPIGANYAPITVLNTSTNLLAYSTTNFTPTFPGKGSITTADFDPKVDFNTLNNTRSVAIGDLDGDGKADLVVANYSAATVSVFRNTGSSGTVSYAPKVDFATQNSQNVSVAIGDLDGDGKADLAVIDDSSPPASVLRNTSSPGTISFAAYQTVSFVNSKTSVAIADLDGDGKADIVASRNGGGSTKFSVIRNTSSPGFLNFDPRDDFGSGGGGSNPQGIAIGDLDGDGKADVVTANTGNNDVSVYRNTSSPGSVFFSAAFDFIAGGGPYSVAIGDLDGDGKADLAVANNLGNSVSVLRNTGPGISFASKVDFATGTSPRSLSIGDLDGDGKADLAIANNGNSTASVLRNTSSSGTINFSAKVDLTTFNNPESIAVGDLDGDGKADLAVATFASTISVIKNDPVFQTPTITSFSPTAGQVGTSVTINGTNFNTTPANNVVFFGATRANVTAATAIQLTVTVPVGATYAPITVLNTVTNLLAYSTNQFTPTFPPIKVSITAGDFDPRVDLDLNPIQNPTAVTITDLDGDGKADLAVANAHTNVVSAFRNTGSIGTVSYGTRLDFASGGTGYAVATGDLDRDGKPDMVVANGVGGSISVFRNTSSTGAISFTASLDLTAGSIPQSIAIQDLNEDGLADIAVLNRSSSSVSIFRNTGSVGSLAFAPKIDFSVGSTPYGIVAGDLDGDGKIDLAIAGGFLYAASVLRNIGIGGTINFAAAIDFPVVNLASSIALGDFDGDGKADLALTNSGANSVSILRNTGNSGTINFSSSVNFAVGMIPKSIAIGDLNGDGKADLAISNQDNTISVLRNNGSIGSISFAAKIDVATALDPVSVAIGDSDGDSKADLVVANTTAGSISVIRNNPLTPPTITAFPNLNKTLYDATFVLTAPTSNSPGAFTYTSSDLSVATVSGSTITVVAAGIATITANQAQSGLFESGSIAATLTITAVETVTRFGERTLNKQTYPSKNGQLGGQKGVDKNGKEAVTKN